MHFFAYDLILNRFSKLNWVIINVRLHFFVADNITTLKDCGVRIKRWPRRGFKRRPAKELIELGRDRNVEFLIDKKVRFTGTITNVISISSGNIEKRYLGIEIIPEKIYFYHRLYPGLRFLTK